jgi:hypothetical protein
VSAGGHDPREVLAAVRRLEADLEDLRARSRPPAAELRVLRDLLASDAAEERRQVVEDLQLVVEVMGTGWRRTAEQIAGLATEVAELRRTAEDLRRAMTGARLELRLTGIGGNGSADVAAEPAAPA